MQKLLVVVVSIMLAGGFFMSVYASDGGMDDRQPKSSGMMGGGMMGGQKGHGSMMMHGEMMSGIGSNMHSATDMMRRMSDEIHKDMSPEHMREMSKIMMDMSSHIKYMSEIMSSGQASQEEMEKINNHMRDMEKTFNMMNFK